jgi:nucleotide-binding universal stress UspA family protein
MNPTLLPQKILVPIDYYPLSSRALEVALGMARPLNAEVHALYVWAAPFAQRALTGAPGHHLSNTQLPNLFDEVRHQCEESMRQFLKPLESKAEGINLQYSIVSGEPQETIVKFAREGGFDWIVLGTHGRAAIPRWFLGSVAQSVVRQAHCPVLVVPPIER